MTAAEIERRLDEVVAALRALATTTATAGDDPATIESYAEAVRLAGAAFDEAVADACEQYGTVFAIPESDLDWEVEDVDGVPAAAHLSVDVRADFVVTDEPSFLVAARRLLAERGGRVLEAQSSLAALDALVDAVGLDHLTEGDPLPGLTCVGGEWGVSAELPE